MERRVVLKLLAAGFASPAAFAQQAEADAYQPAFFTADEMRLLDRLTEILIPADEHSAGASAARVNRFIDVVVSEDSAAVQDLWRSGLTAVNLEADERFRKSFLALDEAQQEAVVAAMAANEEKPETLLERFFTPLKGLTIDGYYTSQIGIHDDLRYEGNTALAEFPACNHPEHGPGA